MYRARHSLCSLLVSSAVSGLSTSWSTCNTQFTAVPGITDVTNNYLAILAVTLEVADAVLAGVHVVGGAVAEVPVRPLVLVNLLEAGLLRRQVWAAPINNIAKTIGL